MDFSNSELLHKEALEHIVGGVNSPSRSYKAVGGGSPVAMDHAKGAYFWDVDGNKFIDFRLAFGPIILGHADPRVNRRVHEAIDNGTLFAHTNVLEMYTFD